MVAQGCILRRVRGVLLACGVILVFSGCVTNGRSPDRIASAGAQASQIATAGSASFSSDSSSTNSPGATTSSTVPMGPPSAASTSPPVGLAGRHPGSKNPGADTPPVGTAVTAALQPGTRPEVFPSPSPPSTGVFGALATSLPSPEAPSLPANVSESLPGESADSPGATAAAGSTAVAGSTAAAGSTAPAGANGAVFSTGTGGRSPAAPAISGNSPQAARGREAATSSSNESASAVAADVPASDGSVGGSSVSGGTNDRGAGVPSQFAPGATGGSIYAPAASGPGRGSAPERAAGGVGTTPAGTITPAGSAQAPATAAGKPAASNRQPPAAPKVAQYVPSVTITPTGGNQPTLPVSVAAAPIPSGPPDVVGTQGQDLRIDLPGQGWIYLGVTDGPGDLEYVSKTVSDGNTEFRFRSSTPGSYHLDFQRQDLQAGAQQDRPMALLVKPAVQEISGDYSSGRPSGADTNVPVETGASVSPQPSATGAAMPGPAGSTSTAADGGGSSAPASGSGRPAGGSTPGAGAMQSAVGTSAPATAGSGSAGGSGATAGTGTDAISGAGTGAATASATPGGTAAGSAAGASSASAAGTASGASAGSQPGQQAGGASSEAATSPPPDLSTPTGLFTAAKEAATGGDPTQAVGLYSRYIEQYGYEPNVDEAYFNLARLYESDPKVRDLKKAIQYYQLIRRQYPFSDYWTQAGDRLRYINRNFIYVR